MPWLFTGFFGAILPLVVLAIAYTGRRVSEFLQRRKISYWPNPSNERVLLAVAAVIGSGSRNHKLNIHVAVLVGGLYGVCRSCAGHFGWTGGALAGNAGLWYLLHETSEYHFFSIHRPGCSGQRFVLIAAHLNRKDFSQAQRLGFAICAWLPSTCRRLPIFLLRRCSIARLPLVIAGLSIAGVFAGIIFRIQAFLIARFHVSVAGYRHHDY